MNRWLQENKKTLGQKLKFNRKMKFTKKKTHKIKDLTFDFMRSFDFLEVLYQSFFRSNFTKQNMY